MGWREVDGRGGGVGPHNRSARTNSSKQRSFNRDQYDSAKLRIRRRLPRRGDAMNYQSPAMPDISEESDPLEIVLTTRTKFVTN